MDYLVLYGRGVDSIAEQLSISVEQAQDIKDSVFRGFPAIKKFEEDSLAMAREVGYVTTVCGRKRRLPDLQLPDYSFEYVNPSLSFDPLDFENEEAIDDIPENIKNHYIVRMNNARGYKARDTVIASAENQGIRILSNVSKKGDAQRQCVNARIQGSAADLTKLAMIELSNNPRLKELGFRQLIPVHDEIIAECPEQNIAECSKLLAETMSKAAENILEMSIKCDVEITKCWYGEQIEL